MTAAPPGSGTAAPLARSRAAILIVLLGLAAVGWAVVVVLAARDDGMGAMGSAAGPDLTMGSASLFFAMWVAMMVAMMFPAAAPMILFYARTQRNKGPAGTTLFAGAYLLLWVAFGAVAFGMAVGVESLAGRSAWIASNWGRAGGILLALAGAYQLSPWKDFCLSRCRTPMSFVMTSWRDGLGGAVRMGLHHGLFCLGCCWLLFLILVPLGVMNVAAMLVVAAVVFAEKAMPWGVRVGRLAAVVLVVYGVAVVLRPELLPTVA